jgi:peptidoglycan/LPS O-acetylase OafA/YrhL
MEEKNSSSIHFPGFGFIRFVLAAVVVGSHVELLCSRLRLPSFYENPVIAESGRVAVSFFFVLSGFLITYLLLHERARTNTINIRKFYMRRILRIWPMYFLVLLLAFFVVPALAPDVSALKDAELPAVHLPGNLLLYVAFLPQLALSLWPPVFLAEPLWSIGVEENFYLLWPWLGKYIRRGFWIVLLIIIIVTPALRWQATEAFQHVKTPEEYQSQVVWFSFLYYMRFECMAVGGLMAWLLLQYKTGTIIKVLTHPITQLLALCGIIGWFAWFTAPVYHYFIPSFFFALLLLGIAVRKKPLLPKTDFLGDYSYSMYLIHEFVIVGVLWLLPHSIKLQTVGGKALLHLLVFAFTMAASWALYRFYEKYFLGLKERWKVV